MACQLLSDASVVQPTAKDPADEIVRPDISWIPSYKVFRDRVETLKALYPNRPTTVPAGWPTEVNAARAWAGSDFKSEDDYVIRLSPEDVLEIEAGLAYFKALPGDLGPDDVSPTTFPLPVLGSRLVQASEIIHDGRGFVVLRGLQPDKYSNFDNILLYLGVTSYIAEKRGMQDFDGRMILHIQAVVEDIKKHGSMPNSPYVARAQPFHTDLCDVLALYALNVAAYGGESFLASSAKIYNELAKTRPDIIEVLAKDDWIFDEFWQGQYHTRPLLYNFESHGPAFQFSRRPLTGSHFSPHHPAVPAMTELQAEALDAVYFLAKEHALEVRLQKGDMLVFNNFAMLHARSGFADDEARGLRRHMLRLWLRNEERMWKTPRELERVSWECYGDHEWRRELKVWDIDRSPPELRVKHRRASCA
ncbi:TauD/TfdA-like domain-containing protein [Madurella fahalii]|uniref:TauD/TfdA-like domain-containing protein n=1 Tax=Madurella fahalii TaxID=1157608 RepID=A0ABQ0GNC8_9PEZI